MATCPRCLGALTENHRCPRQWPSRLGDALATLSIGAGLGVALCFALEERPGGSLLLASAALGAVLARALRDALGTRS
jgi:hypothetical protein